MNKKHILILVGSVIAVSLIGIIWLELMGGAQMINGSSNTTASGKPGGDSGTYENSHKTVNQPFIGQQGLPKNTNIEIVGRPVVGNSSQAADVANDQARQAGLGQDSELEVQNKSTDEYGNSYYELQQQYRGVPVYGAKVLLEVANGNAEILSGTWQSELTLEITPTYEALAALLKAVEGLGSSTATSAEIDGPVKKIIYVSTVGPHLAWELSARILGAVETESVIIDAHNPQFLLRTQLRSH